MRDRLMAVRARRSEVVAAAGDHDGVVAGMDGAFERLVLRQYRERRRFTAILWDALILRQTTLLAAATGPSPGYGLRHWWHVAARRTLLRMAALVGREAYVPGLAGHTPVDTLYVAGRFVADAFRSQGVATPIETTGIPRFVPLCGREPGPPFVPRSATYLTAAYKWHDMPFDQAQQDDLDALAAALPPHGWSLTIRVHPRDDPGTYRRFAERPGVTVSRASDMPLWDLLARTDVVITAISTAGLEALALGRPAVVYLGAFPASLREISFGAHRGVPFARTPDELLAAFARVGGARDTGAMAAVLADFVDPGTTDAAQRIADSIQRHLR
jgi:hypothetical protein